MALTVLVSSASANPIEVSASGNLGFDAPAGVFSVMSRVDFYDRAFVELDAGWGTAGREIGGGIGTTLYRERAKTGKLGWRDRVTASLLVTRSSTSEREAGIEGAPWAELVQGAGTYWWGYAMLGIDLKLENHLYLLTEAGIAVRLARDATYPMDGAPHDVVGTAFRGGLGLTF
jgi:hypothetical protein